MNNKWFKRMALTGAAALILGACGQQRGQESTTMNADNSMGDGKSLTVYIAPQYEAFMKESIADFEKENKDTKITLKTGDALTGLDNLSLDNQSGSAPDVMMAPYDRVGSLGAEGQLSEVKYDDQQLDETTKALVTNGGKVYGSPAVIESLVLYYNKDLLNEAPKTFKDLEALATDSKYAFKGEEGKTTAFLADWTNFYYTYGLLAGHGSYVFGDKGTNPQDIGLDNTGAIEGINYAKTWYDKWPQGMQDTESTANFIKTQFTEGKTAAIIDGPWQAESFKEAKINYGVATIPTLNNGKTYDTFAGGKAWVIPVASKNPELAQKFVDFLSNVDHQKKFYDKTNEIPAAKEARDYAVSKNDDLTTAVIQQFATSQPMPNISEMSTVWDPAKNMLFEAVSGKKEAKAAATDAVTLIKDTIAQKYSK